MSNRVPGETGGGVFLFLMLALVGYIYFILYQAAGNFKTCDEAKYPYQLLCFERENKEQK